MPNNTYKGDIGIKYGNIKDRDGSEGNKTDHIDADDDNDIAFEEDYPVDGDSTRFQNDDDETPEEGFSVLSDSERKYKWEKPRNDESADIPKSKKIKKARALRSESDDDENYDLEIGNNAAGLKILMGLMFIIFIVIISVLIYKNNELSNQYQETQAQLEAAPSEQDLTDARAQISTRDQTIQQLTSELSQYRVANAVAGDLIETPDGSVYVVAANDTLGKIAQEYQVSINQIMDWNNLDNADNIKIGQRLIVKKADDSSTNTTTVTETAN